MVDWMEPCLETGRVPYVSAERLSLKNGGDMKLDENVIGDVVVVRLRGELLDDEDDAAVGGKVTSLLTDGVKKIIVDLQRVRRVNSRGLSTLIGLTRRMRSAGGDIRFSGIGAGISNLFVETRLVRYLPTYESVGRALASFAYRPGAGL